MPHERQKLANFVLMKVRSPLKCLLTVVVLTLIGDMAYNISTDESGFSRNCTR
ncbi:hypothetical protein H6G74_12175 [Nostoc spongiaeforme FACHB-130]|uniref:Uncharacterized protein n=1 Tax=Nostoc spongiaeforme FACHB-130 TaxID=1357510 RepID=A0ABR8FUI1_9NOSO|nr:hypothetical protein [Nostoc spongiaeforme]MBD2595084.1 hypothetical protein [Nostoc spongiaeforme FACHB-130]